MSRIPKVPARYSRTLELFSAAWNTDNPAERERLVKATCSPKLEVSSPYGVHRGIRAQLNSIAEVRAQFPRLRTGGSVLGAHHRVVLSTWWTTFGPARPSLIGIDCCEFDARGRVVRVVSFSPMSGDVVARNAATSHRSTKRTR